MFSLAPLVTYLTRSYKALQAPRLDRAVTLDPLNDRRDPDAFELRPDGRRMLTVPEVAPLVHGSEVYVRKLIRAGVLPARQISPRKTLILEADVYTLLYGSST
jgi:hypothetical protein